MTLAARRTLIRTRNRTRVLVPALIFVGLILLATVQVEAWLAGGP